MMWRFCSVLPLTAVLAVGPSQIAWADNNGKTESSGAPEQGQAEQGNAEPRRVESIPPEEPNAEPRKPEPKTDSGKAETSKAEPRKEPIKTDPSKASSAKGESARGTPTKTDSKKTDAGKDPKRPERLDLPRGPAFYFQPSSGRGLKPVLVYLHGRGGNPEADCAKW